MKRYFTKDHISMMKVNIIVAAVLGILVAASPFRVFRDHHSN
jgi:hypothetical protein